jgi:chromosome segregation ATPase
MSSSQARVSSVEVIDAFRASLIIFQSKARRCLDDAADELRRTRMWLQHEQRQRWENAVRKCARELELAEQELFSAKLSSLRDNISFQQNAVRKAKAALAHAEEKLRNVKAWNRNFDGLADPLAKQLDGLRQFLDFNLPKGITFLVQATRTLESYAEVHGGDPTAATPAVAALPNAPAIAASPNAPESGGAPEITPP